MHTILSKLTDGCLSQDNHYYLSLNIHHNSQIKNIWLKVVGIRVLELESYNIAHGMYNGEGEGKGEGVEWSPMDCEVLSLRCLIMFLPPQLIRLCYNCSCFPFWSGQLALAGLNRIYKSPSDISHHLFSKSLLSRYNLLFPRSLFLSFIPWWAGTNSAMNNISCWLLCVRDSRQVQYYSDIQHR